MTTIARSPRALADLAAGVRTMVAARWVVTVFGVLQVQIYSEQPYPPGHQAMAFLVVGLVALSNLAFDVARRRAETSTGLRRLAGAMVTSDVLLVSALLYVYAFDDVSVTFAVLFLVPVEGAILFGLPGAMWSWLGLTVLYVGREAFATRYGFLFEMDSVTFRTGLIGINAYIVGRLVRDLDTQRRRVEAVAEEVRRLDEFRARVVSMLAHDLRAPLASSKSALTMVRQFGAQLDDERRDAVLDAGLRQNERALLLVRDLLDLARTEAGTLTTDLQAVDVGEVVSRAQELLGDGAQVQVDVDAVVARTDPERLVQVLFNLLDNAVKYGADPIEVQARADGDDVVLTVRDHGPGIPPEVDLFTQFSHAGEDSIGLGMWIVRELVHAMDGRVHHEDASPGARFVLRLPAASTRGRDSSAPQAPDAS